MVIKRQRRNVFIKKAQNPESKPIDGGIKGRENQAASIKPNSPIITMMSREINRLNEKVDHLQKDLKLIHENHILEQEIAELKRELAPILAKMEAEEKAASAEMPKPVK